MTVPCRLAKFHGARSAGGVGTPGLQLFAPYHIFGRMPSPPRDRPKPTTPEEEGIEFYPDGGSGSNAPSKRSLRLLRFIEPEEQLLGLG